MKFRLQKFQDVKNGIGPLLLKSVHSAVCTLKLPFILLLKSLKLRSYLSAFPKILPGGVFQQAELLLFLKVRPDRGKMVLRVGFLMRNFRGKRRSMSGGFRSWLISAWVSRIPVKKQIKYLFINFSFLFLTRKS